MSSLTQFTIVILATLSISVVYGLYKLCGYPNAFNNKYFEKDK